jgi:prephenate dehydrogenase
MAQSKVVICGVGLIGGSFALALKKSALALRRDLQVVGMGRTRAPLEQALPARRDRRHRHRLGVCA